jgi:hypothetical protein
MPTGFREAFTGGVERRFAEPLREVRQEFSGMPPASRLGIQPAIREKFAGAFEGALDFGPRREQRTSP